MTGIKIRLTSKKFIYKKLILLEGWLGLMGGTWVLMGRKKASNRTSRSGLKHQSMTSISAEQGKKMPPVRK